MEVEIGERRGTSSRSLLLLKDQGILLRMAEGCETEAGVSAFLAAESEKSLGLRWDGNLGEWTDIMNRPVYQPFGV